MCFGKAIKPIVLLSNVTYLRLRILIVLLFFLPFSDHVEEVESGSEKEAEVQGILEESYLDPNFECRWQPAKYHAVQNKALQNEFDGEPSCRLI